MGSFGKVGLSALEIYKLLPRTNCRKCGFATCMLFAIKISQRAIDISLCPDISQEAKEKLLPLSRPPIQLVRIGADEHKIEVGNEVVLFRHEKAFYHPPGIFIKLRSSLPPNEISRLIRLAGEYKVERVGKRLGIDGFAVEDSTSAASDFSRCVNRVISESPLPLILISLQPKSMEDALKNAHYRRPLIYGANNKNWEEMAELSLKYKCPLAVIGDGLEGLSDLTERIRKRGVDEIVLDPGGRDFYSTLNLLTQIRRLAIKKGFSPFGYPIITFPGEGAENIEEEALLAVQHIAKYGGLIVLNSFNPETLYPLLTFRLDIYSDPQRPIQVKPGLFPINSPDERSPVCVTTNFSLTYFSVAQEIESSGFPSWLLVCDTEGLSVLTAWAAGKFDGHKIASSVKEFGLDKIVLHKTLIIPGLVAVLRGEIEDELKGWRVLVGPKEAMGLGNFLKRNWGNR